jgi:hypothetical protein
VCPKCKKTGWKLKQLGVNFRCADVICDFCGFVAQVKARDVKSAKERVQTVLGGAWRIQEEKISAGIYHPLYIVKLVQGKPVAIDYIAADFLKPEIYVPRRALSERARRKGWQGFYYDLRKLDEDVIVEVWSRAVTAPKGILPDRKEKSAVSKLTDFASMK